MIIGTAGHIDHGKTALVKALTGVEGDRLREEKARGITIDLGFAYLATPAGATLGFVDVPGHQRLVHTMVAGASGIDVAMLTVAADDGVKPQTLEHLAIIDLLGIPRGIIVITKVDLVGPERISAVTDQILAASKGTTLESAEILAVSALTNAGIDVLRSRLVGMAAAVGGRAIDGRFRLAVDRVFTLAGIGVVVTGTVLSGMVAVGDHVLVSTSGIAARVRSIHSQNMPAQVGRSGERCALNLVGPQISKDAIRRGDVILDPHLHAPTERVDAVVRTLADNERAIGQWFPVRLHHAAAEVGAHIALLDDEPILPGTTAKVQLVLDRPLSAAVPDRFIIRDVSAQRTIGGGKFIDLHPPARKRRTPERRQQRAALEIDNPIGALAALLSVPPFAVDLSAFARDRALSESQTKQLTAELGLATLEADDVVTAISANRWTTFVKDMLDRLAAFHGENPDSQGIGREQLRVALPLRLPTPAFLVALQVVARSGAIALEGAFIRLSSHQVCLSAKDQATWNAIEPLLAHDERFRPPRVRDIATMMEREEQEIRRMLKLARRLGWADEVAHDHFFLRETVREMVAIAADLSRNPSGSFFAASAFRDRLANGRKVAIQILEFFDRHGVTIRKGDLRTVNKHRLDLFGAIGQSKDLSGGESSPVGRSGFKSEWGSETVLGGFDSHSPPPSRQKPRQ